MPRIDLHFPMLENVLETLDRTLDDLKDLADECDAVLDDVEWVVGLGLVACQSYMTTRREAQKACDACACGPLHASGLHVAEIIHAGGNYWKHHPEWPLDEVQLSKDARRTADVLKRAGAWEADYKATVLLWELVEPAPARFASLLPHLAAWREALHPGGFIP
jgi:hypothetical protein